MRKKIGFLVLGLIMAASAYAADEVQAKNQTQEVKQETVVVKTEEVKKVETKKEEPKKEEKKIPKTKWDFSDSNVEFKAYLYDSETKAMYNGKDEDFIMKAKKYLDEKTFIQFKYDTDDSNPDYKLELLVNRKFNDKLEAQMDIDIITGDKLKDGVSQSQGLRVEEDYDSEKVYIKYSPDKNLSFKFNPFDIDLTVGDEFETNNEQKTPGIQMEYKMSDAVKVYAGVGTGKYDTKTKLSNIENAAGKEETVLGFKAGFGYEKDDTTFKIAMSTNTQDDKDIKQASQLKTAVSVIGETKAGNLSLTGEGIFTQMNKASGVKATYDGGKTFEAIKDSETGFAIFGKAKYTMGKNTPFIQVIHASEYAYFDDDDYSAVIGGGNAGHGGLTAIEVGNEYKLNGGLKIIPYIEMLSAKNEIFKDRDGKKDDTAINFATKVKVSF